MLSIYKKIFLQYWLLSCSGGGVKVKICQSISGIVWESSKVTQTIFSWESLAGRKPNLWTEKLHCNRWKRHRFLTNKGPPNPIPKIGISAIAHKVYTLYQNMNNRIMTTYPTRLGGQFGEEQLTTIKSLCMFCRHQLPTSASTDKQRTSLDTQGSNKHVQVSQNINAVGKSAIRDYKLQTINTTVKTWVTRGW